MASTRKPSSSAAIFLASSQPSINPQAQAQAQAQARVPVLLFKSHHLHLSPPHPCLSSFKSLQTTQGTRIGKRARDSFAFLSPCLPACLPACFFLTMLTSCRPQSDATHPMSPQCKRKHRRVNPAVAGSGKKKNEDREDSMDAATTVSQLDENPRKRPHTSKAPAKTEAAPDSNKTATSGHPPAITAPEKVAAVHDDLKMKTTTKQPCEQDLQIAEAQTTKPSTQPSWSMPASIATTVQTTTGATVSAPPLSSALSSTSSAALTTISSQQPGPFAPSVVYPTQPFFPPPAIVHYMQPPPAHQQQQQQQQHQQLNALLAPQAATPQAQLAGACLFPTQLPTQQLPMPAVPFPSVGVPPLPGMQQFGYPATPFSLAADAQRQGLVGQPQLGHTPLLQQQLQHQQLQHQQLQHQQLQHQQLQQQLQRQQQQQQQQQLLVNMLLRQQLSLNAPSPSSAPAAEQHENLEKSREEKRPATTTQHKKKHNSSQKMTTKKPQQPTSHATVPKAPAKKRTTTTKKKPAPLADTKQARTQRERSRVKSRVYRVKRRQHLADVKNAVECMREEAIALDQDIAKLQQDSAVVKSAVWDKYSMARAVMLPRLFLPPFAAPINQLNRGRPPHVTHAALTEEQKKERLRARNRANSKKYRQQRTKELKHWSAFEFHMETFLAALRTFHSAITGEAEANARDGDASSVAWDGNTAFICTVHAIMQHLARTPNNGTDGTVTAAKGSVEDDIASDIPPAEADPGSDGDEAINALHLAFERDQTLLTVSANFSSSHDSEQDD